MKTICLVGLIAVSGIITGTRCEAQSEAAKAFFDKHTVVDGVCFPYYRSAVNRFERNADGKFDMAKYRDSSGVDIAIWDIRRHAEMVKMIRGVRLGHFINTKVIRTFQDVESTIAKNQHGWLFYTQVPWPMKGSIAPLEGWHSGGLRMLQIVYGSTIPISDADQLGTGSSSGDLETTGLTELGKNVVRECNRLGIIVDVSHCNKRTTLEVATASVAPITATHAGCDAITRSKRNKTDEEIIAIAKTGGIFGVTPIKFMINGIGPGATMDDYIRHLDHAVKVAGIDHVGIAADLKRNGVMKSEVVAYTCPELNGDDRWFHLYDALKAKGYKDPDLAKIFGLNYLRVFKKILQ